MSALVIGVVSAAVYLVGFVRAGRWLYARKRPFTEPLSCQWSHHANGEHVSLCYMRPGTLVDSTGEALALALLAGLAWPFLLLALGALRLGKLVFAGDVKALPAERDAKTARLERDLGIGDKR